ncbi:MAG TPA: alpha/beta hydrolase [Planctomycetota bacterium]|nr:alpha/beta hydrolase [Planctomycetota bacterium]
MKTMLLAFLASLAAGTFGQDALTLDLWAGKPPGFQVEGGPERDTSQPGKGLVAGKPVIRTGFVSTPQIVVYAAPAEKANGTVVVVCPGGGFNILAWDLEGTEVAAWLNSIGVAAAVLKYRVPTASLKEKKWEPPVQDCQRALSVVRSKAADWKVNPERVGVLGFSAGGTTAGFCAMKAGERLYEAKDDADKQPCHANFAVLVYPYLLWDAKTSSFPDVVKVSEKMPPVFFAHANDDKLVMDSLQFFLLLKAAKVKGCEMHIYDSGGHGFGMRTADPCSTWPKRCEEWMNKQGFLKSDAAK